MLSKQPRTRVGSLDFWTMKIDYCACRLLYTHTWSTYVRWGVRNWNNAGDAGYERRRGFFRGGGAA